MADSTPATAYRAGWLWKWTNYVNGYQTRWFVLSDGVLSYYLSQEEISLGCNGQIILKSASIFRENSFDFRIEIGNSFRYFLKTSEEADCEDWIKALKQAKAITVSGEDAPNEVWLERKRQVNDEKVRHILKPIESKLDELRSCSDVTEKHSASLLTALVEMESARKKSVQNTDTDSMSDGNLVKFKELNETVMLFRITSSAMIGSCTEFLELLKKQASALQEVLNQEEKRKLQGRRSIEGKYNRTSSSEDEDYFEDASENPSRLSSGSEPQRNHFVETTDSTHLMPDTERQSRDWVYAKHRGTIPNKPDYRLNLWAILKNCIGRDISKLPVPVNFNEPLSILQRLTEELEYFELLNKAAKCTDSCEQMGYVVAFSVSSYSTTAYRVGKPFNPMLGETYEFDSTEEFGFRLIIEQVSHHPPIAAVHAESTGKGSHGGWSYWYEVKPFNKFRGNYLTLIPEGTCHLKFHSSGNHFTWSKVTITVNNIILGKLWFDQSGESNFLNHTTGDMCKMKFFPYNYFDSNSFRKVFGIITDKQGVERYSVHGTWNKSLRRTTMSTRDQREEEITLWKVNTLPPNADNMYFFTKFAILLNEWVEGTAPTDSRRRPDQRKMEDALWDEANTIKLLLEEKQRYRRRLKEKEDSAKREQGLSPIPYKPRWFKKSKCPLTGECSYVYTHEYWAAKERQEWTRCENIYDLTGEKLPLAQEDIWPDLVKSNRIIN